MRRNLKNLNEKNNIEKTPIKGKQVFFLLFWISIFIFIILQTIYLIDYTFGNKTKEEAFLYNITTNLINKVANIDFSANEEEYKLKIAALGEIYTTANTISGASIFDGYDFTTGTEKVQTYLKNFDFVMANLNTPVAGKSLGYSKTSIFNSPLELLETLKKLNVSVLATASYNITDKGSIGIKNTIENIESLGLNQTGINYDPTSRSKPVIIEKNNIKIGILSYTTDLSVDLTSKNDYLVNILEEEKIDEDVKYLNDNNVDIIISYLYVPRSDLVKTENSTQINSMEVLFQRGVNIVFGVGSGLVQGYTEDSIDLNGNKNHIYGIYSLGEFMGSYLKAENLVSAIGSIEVNKKVKFNKKGEVISELVEYSLNAPEAIYTSVKSNYTSKLYLVDDEIINYNNNNSLLTNKEYLNLKSVQEDFQKLYEKE